MTFEQQNMRRLCFIKHGFGTPQKKLQNYLRIEGGDRGGEGGASLSSPTLTITSTLHTLRA